jgi:hypothetical protein
VALSVCQLMLERPNLAPENRFKSTYHFIMSSARKSRAAVSAKDRLCGPVVSVADYKHRGSGFDSRALLRIFLRELGLEQGPLSLVIG